MIVVWWTCVWAWLVALVAMVAIWQWKRADPSAESSAMFVIAVSTFVGTSIGMPVQYFFGEPFVTRRRESRERKWQALRVALKRIERELNNFEHIAAGEGYSGKAHREAVETKSFSLLTEDLKKIWHYWTYGRRVRRALEFIRTRKVRGLIPLLNELVVKLQRDIERFEDQQTAEES